MNNINVARLNRIKHPPKPHVTPKGLIPKDPFTFSFYLRRGIDTSASHYTCHYCKITHELVEAGGMWHCPNPACRGCGVLGHMKNLKSFKDCGNTYTVDDTERKEYCDAFADYAESNGDPELANYVRLCLLREKETP